MRSEFHLDLFLLSMSAWFQNIPKWLATEGMKRNRRYELTWFSWNRLICFGYDVSRRQHHHDRDERNNVHFGLFGLFTLYVFFACPRRLQSAGSKIHKFHLNIDRSNIYTSWSNTHTDDYCGENDKCKIINYPWELVYVEKTWHSPDRTTSLTVENHIFDPTPIPEAWKDKKPYVYEYNEGPEERPRMVKQECEATFYAYSMLFKRKCFPFIKHRYYSIEVEFSQEMGSRCGSWKGGILAMNYAMLPKETAQQTFERMQKTCKLR